MLPLKISMKVQDALESGKAIVALESTLITHGLPFPQGFELLRELDEIAFAEGVIPATIAIIEGKAVVGLSSEDEAHLKKLMQGDKGQNIHKISLRELPEAFAKKLSGGTTVSATLQIAHWAGIQVFATGGIGGVHRHWQESLDISADLDALANLPLILVCAGSKAILDVAATLEYLESHSVPVFANNTNDFPAFYSRKSGYKVASASIAEIAEIYRYSKKLSVPKAILFANPIPPEAEIPRHQIEPHIQAAYALAKEQKISAKALTPFLLDTLSHSTEGGSVQANLALIKNNLLVAAKIAKALL